MMLLVGVLREMEPLVVQMRQLMVEGFQLVPIVRLDVPQIRTIPSDDLNQFLLFPP